MSGSGTNSSISMVRVDSSAIFSRLVLADLDIGVGIDPETFHDVLAEDLFAGIGIDLDVLDAMARVAVDLIEADSSQNRTSPEKAQPDRSRAKDVKCPSNWHAGPWAISDFPDRRPVRPDAGKARQRKRLVESEPDIAAGLLVELAE
jgi:hypothetical protein